MKTVNCPRCGGKGLRIVWGMLPYEAHKECDADPDLTPGGCCIDPTVSHHCERCEHRWLIDGFGIFDAVSAAGPEAGGEGSLWVVGDLNGDRVLSAHEWPEDDSFVWLETEPAIRVTLEEFDLAQGEGVVGWLAEPEPYED